MNLYTIRHPLFSVLAPMLAICLVFSSAIWSQDAQAHKGHAGPAVSFMKSKVALKAMLPKGAKIVKRKQPLTEDSVEWADKTYGIELDEDIYSYYLATSKKGGGTLGAAYVTEVHYRHGDLKIAVGINANKQITQVAILGINEKYVVDFEGSVGTGLIAKFAGLSINDLIAKADELASSDKATREFAAAIRDASVLLAAYIR